MVTAVNYIGLATTGHDSALAVVNSSGEIRYAEAAERHLQNKRALLSSPDDYFRLPDIIRNYCEPGAPIVMAKSWSLQSAKILRVEQEYARRKVSQDANMPPELAGVYLAYCDVLDIVHRSTELAGSALNLFCLAHPAHTLLDSRAYDHHLTHAAYAAYTSRFEEAAVVIVDGTGEGASVKVFLYKNAQLTLVSPPQPPGAGLASLGLFYGMTLCALCGFDSIRGEEWKVMGLAAYGIESYNSEFYAACRDYLKVDGLSLKFGERANDAYKTIMGYARQPGAPAMTVSGIAYTGQLFFADLMIELLRNVHEELGTDNLVLSGGCALNSLCNGLIIGDRTPFKKLYVPSAPADDGNAIGAALLAYRQDHPDGLPNTSFQSPYLGSELSRITLKNLIKFSGIKHLTVMAENEIAPRGAQLLAAGKVIGWAQNRAEFGPRALGNRSILADPRDPDMKGKINDRVKFREEFRPFAPSILDEFGSEYFEHYHESPYMERALHFRSDVADKIPAVVHEDGTGRLHSVKREWNPRYYDLIKAFYQLTGVPVVLNTSLNVAHKPIVHSVEDVLAVFHTSGLDAVIIDNVLIEKE